MVVFYYGIVLKNEVSTQKRRTTTSAEKDLSKFIYEMWLREFGDDSHISLHCYTLAFMAGYDKGYDTGCDTGYAAGYKDGRNS